jgi:hypothetical protein
VRNPRPAAMNPLQGTKLFEWGLLSRASLAALVVSEERRAWILETYPPEETGRPGILVAQERKRVHKTEKREFDADASDELDEVAEQEEMEMMAA